MGISSSVLGSGLCGPGGFWGPSMEKWLQPLHSSFSLGLSWLGERKQKANLLGTQIFQRLFSWCSGCCLPSLGLWDTVSGLLNGVAAGLYSRMAEGSALGQGKTLDLSLGWQEGEARHSRPKSLPHVLLVSSVSHVHGEPLFLISS